MAGTRGRTGFWSSLRAWWARPVLSTPALTGGGGSPRQDRDTDETVPPPLPRALQGGRVTTDSPGMFLGATPLMTAPPSAEDAWRLANLDEDTLAQVYDPNTLLQLLADLSPDISKALWDFLRLCNPGYAIAVLRPGEQSEDTVGQALLDAFLARLHDAYGSFDVVLARIFIAIFLRGAIFAELVLDPGITVPLDLATPDPAGVRFVRVPDPVRGAVWVPTQWKNGEIVYLTRPTVRYVPVDPFPGAPYGRPLAAPALFSSIFLLGLLHDLRRVVAQQGLPRLDIGVDTERLMAVMPEQDRVDPDKFLAWVNTIVKTIEDHYKTLQPDDTYIHADVITMNRPVGTVDANSLGMIDALLNALTRMSARALKTMPMMLGITDGVSEANANRQWELMTAGIGSLQHLVETTLARLFALALQAQGHAAVVQVRFAKIRAAERLRDAQAEQLEIANATAKEGMGYLTHDEAAQEIVGKKAAGPVQWLPKALSPLGAGQPQANAETEPGGGVSPAGSTGGGRAAGPTQDSATADTPDSANSATQAAADARLAAFAQDVWERLRSLGLHVPTPPPPPAQGADGAGGAGNGHAVLTEEGRERLVAPSPL